MLLGVPLSGVRRPWLRRTLLAAVGLILLGVVSQEPPEAEAQGRQPAPQLQGVAWLGSDAPITLRKLRGKIVVLDFWTLC